MSIPLQRITRETPVGADVIVIDDNHRPVLTNTRSEIWEIDTDPPIEMVKVFGRSGGYMAHRVFVLPRTETIYEWSELNRKGHGK